jgi:8-oxo-dGTP pyrophosphatase MutT (NUDIX family)
MLPAAIAELPDRLLPLQDRAPERSHRRAAAVLVLLYTHEQGIRFPLTVRPDHLTRHAGQIALPGGLVEADDRTHWDAALRETREELGIDTAAIVPLGRLATHHLTVSDVLITPFVGWSDAAPELQPDPAEVAEVFDVRLDDLLDPATAAQEEWELRGRRWAVSFYRLDGHAVWGATARILHELVCRLEGRRLEVEHGPGAVLPLE